MVKKEYIPARPTVYNGIKMRSRLEAGFARWLDSWPFVHWKYEPQAFASSKGQYLPDFVADGFRTAWSDGSRPIYFEVKPSVFGCQAGWDSDPSVTDAEYEEAYLEEVRLWTRMSIIWESDQDALLCLVKSRKDGPWADFFITDPREFEPDEQRFGERVDLIQGSAFGYVPAFAISGDPAVPPWPPRYWDRT